MSLPNLLSDDEINEIIEKIIDKVWRQKGMPSRLNDDLVRYFADILWEGITEGYGDDLATVDLDTPDEVMLEKLQASVWHFSAAKDYTQLKALSDALTGPDGRVREFSDYKREAYKITQDHKVSWLKAEYNFAVANGQMASRWVEIERDAELFPNLEYSAVLDGKTTVTCIKLDGVIRPIKDSFWKIWYPPNHFGCRGDVLQNSDDTVTALDAIKYPDDIPVMFKRNLAADGLAFPEGHPYYVNNPDGVKATANKLAKKYGR